MRPQTNTAKIGTLFSHEKNVPFQNLFLKVFYILSVIILFIFRNVTYIIHLLLIYIIRNKVL